MMQRLVGVCIFLSLGCTPELESCNTDADCERGLQCIDALCVLRPDTALNDATLDQRVVDAEPAAVLDAAPDQRSEMPPDAMPADATIDTVLADVPPTGGPLIDAARDAAPIDAAVDSTVEPTPERLCNEADDDGDGQIDEGFEIGQPCTAGTGLCESEGLIRCADAGTTVCISNHLVQPEPEICTPLGREPVDEDCDGVIDEAYGRFGWSRDVAVGLQGNVPADGRNLDVAMTETYTAVLAPLNAGLRVVIFRRGAEEDGSLRTLDPFDAEVAQPQIQAAGDAFIFTAISADNPNNVLVAVLRFGENDLPDFNRAIADFNDPIGRQVLVPSAAGRVTFFVRLQGQAQVIRRDLFNQLQGDRSWPLATPHYDGNGEFAAGIRGDVSEIAWPTADGIAYRTFIDRNFNVDMGQAIPGAFPRLVLRPDDTILAWQDGVRLRWTIAATDRAPNDFGDIDQPPDLADAGAQHFLMAATGAGGGVAGLHVPTLGRNGQQTIMANAVGRVHVAASGRRGAVVWRTADGQVFLRALRFDCR